MKKLILTCLLFIPISAFAKINVVATLPVYGALAKEVCSERCDIQSLSKPGQDPHFLDAKPTYVVVLSNADLLLHSGLELESGWLPPVLLQAQNPKLKTGEPGNGDLSKGITALEIPGAGIDRMMGDVHARGNPHAWLDPKNAKIMAANIYQRLVKIDPDGKTQYTQNLDTFLEKLNAKNITWQQQLQKIKGQSFLTYHKSLSYLAAWAEFNVPDTLEPKPGIPPSSRHLDDLEHRYNASNVKAILSESYYPSKLGTDLAQKIKVPFIKIETQTTVGAPDYCSMMDALVRQLGN